MAEGYQLDREGYAYDRDPLGSLARQGYREIVAWYYCRHWGTPRPLCGGIRCMAEVTAECRRCAGAGCDGCDHDGRVLAAEIEAPGCPPEAHEVWRIRPVDAPSGLTRSDLAPPTYRGLRVRHLYPEDEGGPSDCVVLESPK